MSTTRYPGIASFEDNDILSRLFFGREEESKLLLFSILSEYITVLFSKSGYGKTSLLQADVFRKLRERGFYPIVIRFNKKDYLPAPLIISAVKDLSVKDTINEIVLPETGANLKDFFSKLSIWSPDDKLLHPVLIFDQFEEIFTLKHNAAAQLDFFEELAEIANACKEGDLSIKMVFSIREDFLGHLERLSVKIPSIFTNRFRLEALSKTAAASAITTPASIALEGVEFSSPPFYYSDGAILGLLNFLSLEMVEGKWEPTPYIEPVQLQIICSELESRVRNGLIKKKSDGNITIREEDLGGNEGLGNILGEFYNAQLARLKSDLALSDKEIIAIRNLVEVGLISDKRRVPVDYATIVRTESIREDGIDLLISGKLLKVVTLGGSSLVEISHDSLIEPVLEAHDERMRGELLAAEARRMRSQRNKIIRATVVTALLVSLSLLGWAIYAQSDADRQTKIANQQTKIAVAKTVEAEIQRKRADSTQRQNRLLTDRLKKSDEEAAQQISGEPIVSEVDNTGTEVVSPNPPKPNPPVVVVHHDTVVSQNIFYDPNNAYISISADGTRIIAADKNGHSHLYDIRGSLDRTFTESLPMQAFDYSVAGITLMGADILQVSDSRNEWSKRFKSIGAPVSMAVFSPQFGSPRYLKQILYCTTDGQAGLLDLYGQGIKKFPSDEKITTVAFSPGGKKILTGSSDGVIAIWNIAGDHPIATLVNDNKESITAIALYPNERRLVTGSADGSVTVWDIDTRQPLLNIPAGYKVTALTVRRQPDNIYVGCANGTIRRFNIDYNNKMVATVTKTEDYKGHTRSIQSMYFRESDKRLFTTSADGSARVWQGQ